MSRPVVRLAARRACRLLAVRGAFRQLGLVRMVWNIHLPRKRDDHGSRAVPGLWLTGPVPIPGR